MDWLALIEYFLLFGLFLVALGGTIIGLPGNWLIMFILIIFAVVTDFTVFSVTHVMWAVGLLLLGELLEAGMAMLGASKHKPSKWSLLSAFVGGIMGGIIGTGILPVIGSVLGTMAGVFAGTFFTEQYLSGNKGHAQKVAKSAMLGALAGILIKVFIAIGVLFYLFQQIIGRLEIQVPIQGPFL